MGLHAVRAAETITFRPDSWFGFAYVGADTISVGLGQGRPQAVGSSPSGGLLTP